jgi:hypothetical protein
MTQFAFDSLDLGRTFGIHFMQDHGRELQGLMTMDNDIAYDAQPALVTAANAGIPSLFTTYVDPRVIEILVRPTKSAELYGEEKRGTWVSDTMLFILAERTGEVTSYGDFSNDGMSDANINFPNRQSYHFQTNTRWGVREIARAAEAKVDLASQKQAGSALALQKYSNYINLYGVAGLQLYGGTNDPALPAPIAFTENWFSTNDPQVMYADMLRLVQDAIDAGNGLVDAESPFTVGISPGLNSCFNNTNQFNYNAYDQLKKNFPNLKIVTVPEFAVNGGGRNGGTELIQLIVDEVEGVRTCTSAFTEKQRAHAMVTKTSSWEQKKSSGAWGVVIYRPVFVRQMYG